MDATDCAVVDRRLGPMLSTKHIVGHYRRLVSVFHWCVYHTGKCVCTRNVLRCQAAPANTRVRG